MNHDLFTCMNSVRSDDDVGLEIATQCANKLLRSYSLLVDPKVLLKVMQDTWANWDMRFKEEGR